MKIGVFADIHGNIYAFSKVWEALRKESCDEYVFAGDVCGYYYYQNDVIDILRNSEKLTAVRGNHDAIFLEIFNGAFSEEEYGERYGRASSFLKTSITEENLKFLKGLPDKLIRADLGMAVFHGSPWKCLDEYIYPDNPMDRFGDLPYKYVVLGHTHRPMDKRAGSVRILNPGSCGQPRDNNDPSYATIDTDTGEVIIKRVRYDANLMAKDVVKRGEKNAYLTDVLTRGKKR